MSDIQLQRDLRDLFGPPRDQGPRPTCLAFALSDAHAAANGAPWSPLSCEYLFYCAKQRDGSPPKKGTTLASARAALEHDGQPTETGWPYSRKINIATWKPPTAVGTLFHKATERSGNTFNHLWTTIDEGKPIVLAMTLSNAFYHPDKRGVVDSSEAANPAIRHAVLGIGIGHSAGMRLVLVRNSWGHRWGVNGHAWLSEQYVTCRIRATLTTQ